MPKVLRIAVVSLGALVLSSAVALAQAPPPSGNAGHATTSTQTKRHKSASKKSTHKKSGKSAKKKAPKKTAH